MNILLAGVVIIVGLDQVDLRNVVVFFVFELLVVVGGGLWL